MSATERVCSDLDAALDELRGAGFRLDSIYPADEPHTALLSRGKEQLRVTTCAGSALPAGMPPFTREFLVTRAGEQGAPGRAGMIYRDLIPGRLGGRYIASHITIPKGGAVADWVHYHRVAVQLIAVRRGWVKVVYEGQGEPFVMRPGDLVLQPPQIRHRVLESSAGLEVVEISCPALHETLADHDLELPTDRVDPGRDFAGQRFLRHVAAETPWTPHGDTGFERCETAMADATGGLAAVRVIRPGAARGFSAVAAGELQFGFVLEGAARLDHAGDHPIGRDDAFVIPPGAAWGLAEASDDLRVLEVVLPATA